jgi:hypothetical protein
MQCQDVIPCNLVDTSIRNVDNVLSDYTATHHHSRRRKTLRFHEPQCVFCAVQTEPLGISRFMWRNFGPQGVIFLSREETRGSRCGPEIVKVLRLASPLSPLRSVFHNSPIITALRLETGPDPFQVHPTFILSLSSEVNFCS